MGPLQKQSTGQTHCCAQKQELAILAFKKKKFHTCPLKPTKPEPSF